MIRAGCIAQGTLGDQSAGECAGAAGDGFSCKAGKMPGGCIEIELDAIDIDGLADIACDDIGIVAAFFQVIIGPFC